jgi:hypothetical protein
MHEFKLVFEPWRDNSMNTGKLRFKFKFEGFTFTQAKRIDEVVLQLAAQIADQLERDLNTFDEIGQ